MANFYITLHLQYNFELSFGGRMQHPKEVEVDLPFIISMVSESVSKSI